jgi:hypothetical protein
MYPILCAFCMLPGDYYQRRPLEAELANNATNKSCKFDRGYIRTD